MADAIRHQPATLPLRAVVVAGTGTDVGKTVLTAGLLRALRVQGVRAQAVKPLQTGIAPHDTAGSDAAVHAQAVADLPALPDVVPAVTLHSFPLPASPHLAAARVGQELTVQGVVEDIRRHWAGVAGRADMLLLECAGGLCVPLNSQESMLDALALLDCPVILVGRNELGCLNAFCLSLAALHGRGLGVAGLCLSPSPAASEYGDDAIILRDNEQFLARRLSGQATVLALPRLPAAPVGADWARLADVLAPLARQVVATIPDHAQVAEELVKRDHACVWHPYASVQDAPPLCAVRRSHHNRLVLEDGRELVDGMSSWWAAIHGYNHPRLLAALRGQAGRMPHVMFGGLTHAPAVRLAERLLACMPHGLSRVFLADSGSVAVEVAMKMALQYHMGRGDAARTRFATVRGGYHGDTMGAMSVCDPHTGMHGLFAGMLAQQFFLPRPSCRFDAPFDPASLDAAKELFASHGSQVAAVILEPVVQGAGGMWLYHPDYLRGLAAICRQHGSLLILDEIATGFGRTGRWFAAEWAGIGPDILCCGKALTGGVMTLAATACTDEVARTICTGGQPFMHGPTYMGNPLACAVANASLDILEEGAWPQQVARLEQGMREGLAPCRRFGDVADVRVLGGIGVVEMAEAVNTRSLHGFFVEQGVWLRPFGRLVYLMPPYISSQADVERLCASVCEAIRQGRHRQ